MKPSKNQVETTAMQATSNLHVQCRHRRSSAYAGPVRTVTDDSGSLAITVWTCTLCGDLIEEIRLLSRDGRSRPYPIRYAVASQTRTGWPSSMSISS